MPRYYSSFLSITLCVILFLPSGFAVAAEPSKAEVDQFSREYGRHLAPAENDCRRKIKWGDHWEYCEKTCKIAAELFRSHSFDLPLMKQCVADHERAKEIQTTLPRFGNEWMPDVDGVVVRAYPRSYAQVEAEGREDWVKFCSSSAKIPSLGRGRVKGTKVRLKKVQYDPQNIGGTYYSSGCTVGEVEILE